MQENQNTAVQPFQRNALGASVNQGAVAIEQERAIAEAQGQLILAKRFPRSMAQATADFLESCKSPEFASQAFYSVPNRGSGPSIRMMEEAARCYGNFQFGHRELSRSEGKSEVEVFAWDMEKNNRSTRQITVMHIMDTRNGPRKLVDQADIDNKIANVASKQVRGRIAALLPKALIAAGVAACKLTLAGNNEEPISARITRMTAAFAKFGVTAEALAKYIGHKLDTATVDELADLIGVFNAIKEGAKASEYFGGHEPDTSDAASAVNAAIGALPAAKPAPIANTETPQATKPAATKPAARTTRKAAEPTPPPAEEPTAQEPAEEPEPIADPEPSPDQSADPVDDQDLF